MKNPWDIKKDEFPASGSLEDKIKFVLGYGVLAPSTHNSQPWLFKIVNNSCSIYYDNKLRLPEADPIGRDLYISIGCLIENIVIAADYFGIFKEVQYILSGNHVAEIIFHDEEKRNLDLQNLIDTIPNRINVRGLFEKRSLSGEILSGLTPFNTSQYLRINFVSDQENINKLASLTARGQKLAHGRLSFRKEMRRWMHNDLTMKKDGMPGYSLKMPFLLSFIIPILVRLFDMSPLLAKLNYSSMVSAPVVSVITADDNSELIWLETGRLAERLMLHLQSRGISTSIFVSSIEMGDLYKDIQQVLDISSIPQFLFCLGYMSGDKKHSPRHPVNDKLT